MRVFILKTKTSRVSEVSIHAAGLSDQPDAQKVSSSSTSEAITQGADCGLPPYRPTFANEGQPDIGGFELDQGITVPAPINRFLRPYQREGAKFFYDKYKAGTGGVLGDDMGWVKVMSYWQLADACRLGKTIQVIAFLSAIMRKTGTIQDHDRRKQTVRSAAEAMSPKHWPTALIVCPKSLIRNVRVPSNVVQH